MFGTVTIEIHQLLIAASLGATLVSAIAVYLAAKVMIFPNNHVEPKTSSGKPWPSKFTSFMKLSHLPEKERSFVVFLIGFKVVSWRKLIVSRLRAFLEFGMQAFTTFQATTLRANYEDGCLGSHYFGSIFGDNVSVQYWRSFEDLQKFGLRQQEHNIARKQYYKGLDDSGLVGIWHEAFLVHQGDYENVYWHMPPYLMSELKDGEDVDVVELTSKLKIGKSRRANTLEH